MRRLEEGLRAAASASATDWPFEVAALVRDLEAELAQPGVLVEIADKLLDIARDHECQAVVGASRIGGQLAGAVIARATNGLRLFSAAAPSERVLFVDGVIATGTQIARSVRIAKASGAKRAVAAAIIGDQRAIDACREEIAGDVVVLEVF